jgi:DNA-binding HxlR family transcriptional regulator
MLAWISSKIAIAARLHQDLVSSNLQFTIDWRRGVKGAATIRFMADSSPLAEALARVGDRWTLLIVDALLTGPLRFNDLLGQIPGIAANILSERLKRLERDALLVARPYSERPPRAAYQLTAEGTELAGALRLLAYWGARHTGRAEAPRHPACGTPLEARWYCPTCDHLANPEPQYAGVRYL